MKLEEQIRPHVKYWDCYNDEPLEYNHTGKLLKIMDIFTIGFMEWFYENDYLIEWLSNDHKREQLLKAYKKTL